LSKIVKFTGSDVADKRLLLAQDELFLYMVYVPMALRQES